MIDLINTAIDVLTRAAGDVIEATTNLPAQLADGQPFIGLALLGAITVGAFTLLTGNRR